MFHSQNGEVGESKKAAFKSVSFAMEEIVLKTSKGTESKRKI